MYNRHIPGLGMCLGMGLGMCLSIGLGMCLGNTVPT